MKAREPSQHEATEFPRFSQVDAERLLGAGRWIAAPRGRRRPVHGERRPRSTLELDRRRYGDDGCRRRRWELVQREAIEADAALAAAPARSDHELEGLAAH